MSSLPSAANRLPGGYIPAPNRACTAACVLDLDSPTTPSGCPVEVAQPRSRPGQLQDDRSDACGMLPARQENVAAPSGSQEGVVPCMAGAPSHHLCSLQRTPGASPIDLLTPSTGAASTVATPTFSELSEVCDLTQS